MKEIEQLKKEIRNIKERDKRVEADKAWEISLTRKVLLTVFTYLSVGIYLRMIDLPKPWYAVNINFAFF